MKQTANNNSKNAAQMKAAELATAKREQGTAFGDLFWDNYGKSSIIICGNIDDHAAELEALGGRRIMARYSALQNGRKWTERMGRTDAYLFSEARQREALQYLTTINAAIFDAALRHEGEQVKAAEAYEVGERVATIYGSGEITKHTARYGGGKCCVVKLDRFTYRYGWKGMPQTFVEVSAEDMRPEADSSRAASLQDSQEIDSFTRKYCASDIIDAAQMGATLCLEHEGKRIKIRTAYTNGHNDPQGWTYCVTWYEGKDLRECENGVTLLQAAHAMSQFKKGAANGLTLSEILNPAA